MGVRCRLLGPVAWTAPGHGPVAPGGTMVAGLLARLALSANRVIPTVVLAEDLWDDPDPDLAASNIRINVSRLRTFLGSDRGLLATESPGYVLRLPASQVDLLELERLVGDARSAARDGAFPMAADGFRDALSLFTGPPLHGLTQPFVAPAVTRIESLRVSALEGRVQADLECGRHRDLIVELEELTAHYPLHEELWAARMTSLVRVGRPSEALRVYSDLREILGEQLGLEPSPALRELELTVLREPEKLMWVDPDTDAGRVVTARASVGLAGVRGTLPQATTSFVGRLPEMATLDGLIGSHRLVTVSGVGGSGKTRLALHVAQSLAPSYASGAWLVDLTATGSEDDVALAVATSLDVPPASSSDTLDRTAAYIGEAQALIVVDNCEHVLAHAARSVAFLLGRCPRLTVLATSRERLYLRGEAVLALSPLDLPAPASVEPDDVISATAARLFCDRARTAEPTFALDEVTAPVVAEICTKLEGLPLAIELAAAELRVLAPDQLLRRLAERVELAGADRDAPQRHETLQSLVGWSYGLLSGEEAAAFRALSVFQGSFAVEEAEAVVGRVLPAAAAASAVRALVDKSLVAVGAQKGLHLLAVLRQFASDELARSPEELATSRAAHAEVMGSLAESYSAGPATERAMHAWFSSLDARQPDVLSALSWYVNGSGDEPLVRMVTALVPYWIERGRSPAALGAIDAALSAGHVAAPLRGKLLLAAGDFFLDYDYDRSVVLASSALDIFSELGDSSGQSRAQMIDATVEAFRGNILPARQKHMIALDLARDSGDLLAQASALEGLGRSSLAIDPEESLRWLEAAVRILRLSGDDLRLAWTLNNIGTMRMVRGELSAATSDLREAAEIFERSSWGYGRAWVECAFGQLALETDDFELAESHFTAAYDKRVHSGRHGTLMWAVSGLGECRLGLGDTIRARHWFAQALELTSTMGDSTASWMWICHHFARLLLAEDLPMPAAHLLGACHARRPDTPYRSAAERKYELAVSEAQERLDDARFRQAWERGMTLARVDIRAIAEMGIVIEEVLV